MARCWLLFFLLSAVVVAAFLSRQRAKRVVSGMAQPREATAALVALESRFKQVLHGVFLCGGTLIGPRVILTAAHCVYHEKTASYPVTIRVAVNTYNRTAADGGSDILTNQLLLHPSYITSNYSAAFDVALVFLPAASALDVCESVLSPQVARLPTPLLLRGPGGGLRIPDLRSAACYILGWGQTEKALESPIPLHADVRGVREEMKKEAKASVLAADGIGETRACFGDSGGPLICEINSLPYLVGVSAEIGEFASASSLPRTSYLRCAKANRLTAFDVGRYLPIIYELLHHVRLYDSVQEAQEFCFGDNLARRKEKESPAADQFV